MSNQSLEIRLPENFTLLAAHRSSRQPSVKLAINYIMSRGLTEKDMWYFKFGVSNHPDMRRRVIMPSFDAQGMLNFYTARAIDKGAFRKYMNSKVDKKNIIFNEINIDWSEELTIVEGPFDLTKCNENAVPLLGSSLTEDSLLFSRIYEHKTPVLLALDADMEQKEWQRIAKMLSYYDIRVRILDPTPFQDVGEMTKKQFAEKKRCAVQWSSRAALRKKIKNIKLA